jgi:hypothetical protein
MVVEESVVTTCLVGIEEGDQHEGIGVSYFVILISIEASRFNHKRGCRPILVTELEEKVLLRNEVVELFTNKTILKPARFLIKEQL